MKIKKSLISCILGITIMIVSWCMSFWYENIIYFYLITIIMIVIFRILIRREIKPINQKLDEYFLNGNFNDAVEYLKIKKDNNWFIASNKWCINQLILTYMFSEKEDEAYSLILKYEYTRKTPSLYYANMLFAIANNDNKLMNYYANKLLKSKHKYHINQKEMTKKILEMVNTNTFNNEIYEQTKIPLLKKICENIKDK